MISQYFETRNLVRVKRKKLRGFQDLNFPTAYDSVIVPGKLFDDGISRLAVSTNKYKVYFFNCRTFDVEDYTISDNIYVYVVKVSEYHRSVVTGSHFGIIKFYSVPEMKLTRRISLSSDDDEEEFSQAILYLSILDYRNLVCCMNLNPYPDNGKRGWVVFVDFETYPVTIDKLEGHGGSVWISHQLKSKPNLVITAGGDSVMLGEDFRIRVWDYKKREMVNSFRNIHEDRVVTIISLIENNEEFILSGGRDGKIVMWNLRGDVIRLILNDVCTEEDEDVAKRKTGIYNLNHFRRDLLLVGGEMGTVNMISMNQGIVSLKNEELYHTDKVYSICWVDEEKRDVFVSVSMNGIQIFKIEDRLKTEVQDCQIRVSFIQDFVVRDSMKERTRVSLINITFLDYFNSDLKKNILTFRSLLNM